MSEIILSNEQISVARYSENGVIRINGGPGSGKTLVAVKRAIFLAKEYKYAEKNDKILFLFYNKSLKNIIQKDEEKIFDSSPIHAIFRRYCHSTISRATLNPCRATSRKRKIGNQARQNP